MQWIEIKNGDAIRITQVVIETVEDRSQALIYSLKSTTAIESYESNLTQ